MNTPTLTIDVVSDIVCPWCYIGKRKLEAALALPEASDLPNVVIRWHPFQLNPDLPLQGVPRQQYLEDKFGGPERAAEIYDRIRTAGQAVGLTLNLDGIKRQPNTLAAHALIAFAQAGDFDSSDIKERLLKAYFVENRFIGSADVLAEIAEEAGLNGEDARLFVTDPEQLDVVDPQHIHAVRESMRAQLATALADDWQWVFEAHEDNGAYRPDTVSSGRRALAGMALAQLCLAARDDASSIWPGKTYQRFKDAGNMTDGANALQALIGSGHALAEPALARFHSQFKNEELVLDKWFALQAGACDRGGQVLPAVRQLLKHPDFSIRNPNRARSVIFSYCSANPGAFHRLDAAGYVFWSERVIELDSTNPQVAARLARALDRWKKLAEPYRSAAREAIVRVAAKTDLSNDVREVVSRALAI